MHELKHPAIVVGAYLSVVQLSGMVATPIAGSLSDRIGPKRVAAVGGALVIGNLIVLMVPDLKRPAATEAAPTS